MGSYINIKTYNWNCAGFTWLWVDEDVVEKFALRSQDCSVDGRLLWVY